MSSRNQPPTLAVMKESSLRNLKQKIQRNEITSIAGRSAMTMPGPTVNMITTNESGGYGPGFAVPDKTRNTDQRIVNNRFAVPPSDPPSQGSPTHRANSSNRFIGSNDYPTTTVESLPNNGYSRRSIEEISRHADKTLKELQQQQQQKPEVDQNVREKHFYSTLPEVSSNNSPRGSFARQALFHQSESGNGRQSVNGTGSTNRNQNDVRDRDAVVNSFSQSFPGNSRRGSGQESSNSSQSQYHYSLSATAVPDLSSSRSKSGGITAQANLQPASSSSSSSSSSSLVSTNGIDSRRCVEVGLDNLGNTCFMNSTLQCLLHIQPLVQYFLHADVRADLNLASPKKGVLATSFLQLVKEMYTKPSSGVGRNSSIAPVSFQKAVGTYAPYLMDYQQQDSQEFLRFLLDGMSEDLCRKHSTRPDDSPIKQVPVSSAVKELHHHNHQMHCQELRRSIIDSSNNNSNQSENEDCCESPTALSPMESVYNHHSGSPYTSPTEQSSSMFSSTRGGAFSPHSSTTEHHCSSTTKLRLMSDVGAARNNSLLVAALGPVDSSEGDTSEREPTGGRENGEIDGEDDDCIFTSASSAKLLHSQEERGQQRSDISGNIRDVIQARRSIRLSQRTAATTASSRDVNNQTGDRNEVDPSMHTPQKGEKLFIQTGNSPTPSGSHRDEANRLAINRRTDSDHNAAVVPPAPTATNVPLTPEQEAALSWGRYLKLNDSVITDIFAGQLQSTIECLTCRHRSSSYDPFLDLSVPIHRDCDAPSSSSRSGGGGGGGGGRSGMGLFSALKVTSTSYINSESNNSTLEKCLTKFTAEEILEGDNMYTCEKCKTKRRMAKKLSIFRYPKVLVIHIKRFRFNHTSREKLSTDVQFPLSGLDLSAYVSADVNIRGRRIEAHGGVSDNQLGGGAHAHRSAASHNQQDNSVGSSYSSDDQSSRSLSVVDSGRGRSDSLGGTEGKPPPIYDLVGVSNHHGGLNGGHYIAHVDTSHPRALGVNGSNAARWMCFNDSRVSNASAASIAGPTAYVLFYQMRED